MVLVDCADGTEFQEVEYVSDVKCTHPITLRTGTFNCGQCHACRINYTSGWTLRLLYELTCWDSASFITLTYDDYHLPLDMSLHLSHVQKFMDNLRHRIDWKIKFYHCGEYGSKRKRPHYHIILFGLDPFNLEHRKIVYECWKKCDPMFFDKLPNNWKTSKSCQGKGMLPVCREDIAYVCGYVQKKLTGELGEKEYDKRKRPYSTCSKGIGLDHTIERGEILRRNRWTYLNGKRIGLPRYVREKLGIRINVAEYRVTKSRVERISEEWRDIRKQFEKRYPNLVGHETSKMYQKFFENWYERREWDYSNQILRDYLEKKHMKYGIE